MMTKFSLFLGGALLALSSLSPAAKFYKWVDDEGVTHYDAQAPQGTNATEVNTRANASSDQGEAIEALEAKRSAAEKAKETAATQAKEEQRLKTEPDAVAQERCEQHRKNLETLTNKPTVRRKNPDTGEMEVLDQEARDQMVENTRSALEKCEAR
ncbi:DUF4124 domain-containing protein [Alcanivorax sp.]|jgi:hypothetical protein|uniref:DUF4124 domain-containing protein n=1 Tax=Alcanivorax sp. TaxID=1872427 RepID=UPI0032D8F787